MTSVKLVPLYWDMLLGVRENIQGDKLSEKEEYIRLVNKSYFYFFSYCMLFREGIYEYDDGMIVFPSVSSLRDVSLQYRVKGKYDDFAFRWKERKALLRFLFTWPYLKAKRPLLVYEKSCETAQDNGFYFFQYCMEHDMERVMGYRIYYVIDKKSPDYARVQKYEPHVLDYMTTKHIVYALATKLYVSPETKAHAYPMRRKGSSLSFLCKRAPLLFLQHGVLGLKRVEDSLGYGRSHSSAAFVVSGDCEEEIVRKYLEYPPDRIANVGLCRWDALFDKSDTCREILVMPTWRDWLEDMTDKEFLESAYFHNYLNLLNSTRLISYLESYDYQLKFYLHPKMKMFLGEFQTASQRIHLCEFTKEPLNENLMRAGVLITDYSSVCWDMYYQSKPVIFFQFDREDYNQVRGGYLDLKDGLFGSSVETLDQLLDELEKQFQKHFLLDDKWKEKQHDYYSYMDHEHARRTCDYIMEHFKS